jgi:glycerate 2-kinase
MIIDQFDHIVTNPARKMALRILEAGLRAAKPSVLVETNIRFDWKRQSLHIRNKSFALKDKRRVFLFGAGLGCAALTTELYREMKPVVHKAVVIDTVPSADSRVESLVGTRMATVTNLAATQKILGFLKDLSEDDLVIWVLAGGGSSLLGWPASGTSDQQRILAQALETAGATYSEIQTVRRHISKVKGGHLAKLCFPATVISLIVCDDPSEDLGLVAGGVTVPDSTTIDEARHILERYHILEHTNLMSIELFETPKEAKVFKNVHNIQLASGQDGVMAMKAKAHDLGLRFSHQPVEAGIVLPRNTVALLNGPAPLALDKAAAWLSGSHFSATVAMAEGSGGQGYLVDPEVQAAAQNLIRGSLADSDQTVVLLRDAGANFQLKEVLPSIGSLFVMIQP